MRFLRPMRLSTVRVHCSAPPRAIALRKILAKPGFLLGPCCHDGLSAKLIEKANFPYAFMSGFTSSAAKLGAPDVGLLTYSEMVEKGRDIHEATDHIPIIGDGDTGYGNPMNVKRTVSGYANAGFAGILIEDQVWPKSCGHVKSKQVVSRREAVERIAAAVEARGSPDGIIILARTDARQAESLDEALYRIQAFAEAGADMLFIDALESMEEMEKFGALVPSVPKMANMLEGGGKTPILTPQQLEDVGFKLAAYPLSLLGVSMKAMQEALDGLQTGKVPDLNFKEMQNTLGFDLYFDERDSYGKVADEVLKKEYPTVVLPKESPPGEKSSVESAPLDADAVFTSETEETMNGISVSLDSSKNGSDEDGAGSEDWFPSFARVCVTNRFTQNTKMEFKIPVGFLNHIQDTVPAMKQIDLRSILKKAQLPNKEPVVQFTDDDDLVEVFLE